MLLYNNYELVAIATMEFVLLAGQQWGEGLHVELALSSDVFVFII